MAIGVGEIRTFLEQTGKADLYAWLDVPWTASRSRRAEALKKQRAWAQAQQSNPKHKDSARWVIQNYRHLKELVVDDPQSYRTMLATEHRARGEARLRELVETLVDDGVGESEVRILERYAWRQGLEASYTRELLRKWGVLRVETPSETLPTLSEVIQQVMAHGLMPLEELNRVLAMGQATELPEQALVLMVLDRVRPAAS